MNEWINKLLNKYMENTSILFQSAISRFSFPLCLLRESDRMRLFISYWIICFELSLNTCLHITYRTDMGTSRDESEQNGIVVSVRMTSKCCSSFFTMSLFLHVGSKSVILFQSSKETLTTCRVAGWSTDLTQCFQIQSKWMWRPDTQKFNWGLF